jgi:hypothetical protein
MSQASSDPRPYARFILTHLLKRLPEGHDVQRAVSETEVPIEKDDWYWADDNAKVLALLALPQMWHEYREEVSEIIRFVISMCEGPLIFRRIATPRFEVLQCDGGSGQFRHSLMDVACDLSNGTVSLGMRFHDGRTAKNVTLVGAYVQFRHRGRNHTVDLRGRKFRFDIEILADHAKFHWSTTVEVRDGFFRPKIRRIGEIAYVCTIRADSMFVDMEAMFELDGDVEISDVIIAFGLDDLSHDNDHIRYEMVSAAPRNRPPLIVESRPFGHIDLPIDNGTYWAVWQNSHMLGFASAVHTLPRDPSHFVRLRVMANMYGRLERVVSEHRFPGRQRGKITASERKVLTSGGLYRSVELYANTLTRHSEKSASQLLPLDLSISYDYGAEIFAFARCLRAMASDNANASNEVLRRESEIALANLLQAYDDYFIVPAKTGQPAVFSRSLAFVALARAEMLEASGDPVHSDAMREICELIATFERAHRNAGGAIQSGFLMGKETDSLPYVDCHSSCLLALVRATQLLGDPRWLEAIDRGLAAFQLDRQTIGFCGKNHEFDVVCVEYFDEHRKRHSLETFWNFKVGLSLSLFNALTHTRHEGLKSVWSKHKDRLAPLEAHMRAQIERSIRISDGSVEIRCSELSGETNSETQPWVALALIGEF